MKKTRKIHIDLVQIGDVVECEDGHSRTVGRGDLKKGGFTGTTLWGDSYWSGYKPVVIW